MITGLKKCGGSMRVFGMLTGALFKRHKRNVIKISILSFVAALCLSLAYTVFISGETSVTAKMNELGYGDLTVWTNELPEETLRNVQNLEVVNRLSRQELIYADYKIGDTYSDNEGQLLEPSDNFQYVLTDENGIRTGTDLIEDGEIYISPAMKSSFEIDIGTTVFFDYSRSEQPLEFIVAGYFEDPFMGSSMIDMKSFLISQSSYQDLLWKIRNTKGADKLAEEGSMLHLSMDETLDVSYADFSKKVMTETDLSLYTRFSYSRDNIRSYMLLLQNILSGFLGAFALLLFIISFVIASNSLREGIEQEKEDISNIKTIGVSGHIIRKTYLLLYVGSIEGAATIGIITGILLTKPVVRSLISSTGLLSDINIPLGQALIFLTFIGILTYALMCRFARKVLIVSPVSVFSSKEAGKTRIISQIRRPLLLTIAIRDVLSSKRKHLSLVVISVLMVLFLSVVGQMAAWLGPNGEGLMNAFSVAEHDIGVQPFSETVPMDEIERVIAWYSPIVSDYELAMESINVNGQEYTANVLNDTSYFHVLKGRECGAGEVLITETVAEELGIDIGDTLQITGRGVREDFTVSGIYMCANGMGTNIGMSLAGYSRIGDINGFIWCHHYILENGAVRDFCADYLNENYKGIDVHTNSWSGLSGIVRAMHGIIVLIYFIIAIFIITAVSMVASGFLLSEAENIAVYRSIGIRNKELVITFALRFLISVLAGAIAGLIVSALLSGSIITLIFKNFGIGEFINSSIYLAYIIPLAVVPLLFTAFAVLFGKKISKSSAANILGTRE